MSVEVETELGKRFINVIFCPAIGPLGWWWRVDRHGES